MDSRRPQRTVIDPKVRQVGFFAPPDRSVSGPPDPVSSSSPPTTGDISPSGRNSLSPVMIPPPRHASAPLSPLLRDSTTLPLSHTPTDLFPATSPTSSSVTVDDAAVATGKGAAAVMVASGRLPAGGFQMPPSAANLANEKAVGSGGDVENDLSTHSKPLKEKTTKAERRALQEAQRAAKAAARAEKATSGNTRPAKPVKAPVQKNDIVPLAATEKKGGDRPVEKDRKKEVPQPRMQYDDKSRVEKAKRRAVVKQKEVRNRVELFRHLPQYEHGTLLDDLELKFFQLDPMHPSVYKVGLQYLTGDICGGNARCTAMLQAFQDVIRDYSTPPEKTLIRDLTAKIGSYVSFLIECRPLSISMGNAIRFLKNRIAKLPLTLSESEAKAVLCVDIDRFINEKIILADNVIVKHAVTKIRDGDVLLTYGSSSAVEMILLHAHELGKQFRVVIVDSRPKLEGQLLLRRLVANGLSCTYTHINAVSYVMHEVSRVFLGASSVLANGTVYSRVGTASVAMVAHAFRVPVLVCCEAYKFHERVQLDSICSNELGNPAAISKVRGREDINFLDGWASNQNLQLLNLIYDATPSEYVSMIITDYGMVPPTSVPVIVREYRREHLWI